MKNLVIVLPTYNERDNIRKILDAIFAQKIRLNGFDLSVLVVDDSSPDGTAEIVKTYQTIYPNLELLKGKKQGLGTAYIRGFKHAMNRMKADVIFEMDADFSHNPDDIPRLAVETLYGADFVIGSRYIPGGSIPSHWSKLRVANSKWGNIFARHVAGLGKIKDCTSGFRAIKVDLLRKIKLNKLSVKGYAFQISLLHAAINNGARITEVPINFRDRVEGESKLRIGDITEFVVNSFLLRFPVIKPFAYSMATISLVYLIMKFVPTNFLFNLMSFSGLLSFFVGTLSLVLILQGIFTLVWMLYAWENPEEADEHKSPKEFALPKHAFTALIPAKNETSVIQDTIRAINKINYPDHLKEALILCRYDDLATIQKAQETIDELNVQNIRVVTFNGLPINKPHALNQGLSVAKHDIVTIFDAEDEPHFDIYNIINTVMIRDNADVIQSGVQLMNYRSNWFSTLNVLEYFFWFKSGLNFFTKVGGVTPLGGNTVFFKTDLIRSWGGWDETCLTEDAAIGFKLAEADAKIITVYDEQHVTKEETPSTISSFVKQRTRWNQGFLQIFFEGEWLNFSKLSQRVTAVYILLSPVFQLLLLIYTPIAIWVAFTQNLPIVISLFSFIPFFLLILQIAVYVVGLYEFTKAYKLRFPFWMPFKIMFTFYPYQLMLAFSSLRAVFRILVSNNNWEKTKHLNAHRAKVVNLFPKGVYATKIA